MVLLTNDDGIEAPGLAALERAVGEALPGEECLVVAPAGAMSECSHCVTTQQPIRVERVGERRFAVHGTPADCVRVAILHLLPTLKLRAVAGELRVFSGINAGGNLGADVYISGTIAAVREAAFFGVPGIAFSQYRKGEPREPIWTRAQGWAREVIGILEKRRLEPFEFWSVNFPWQFDPALREKPEVVFCERSRRPLPVKYEEVAEGLKYAGGRYHLREYEKGSDIDVCFGGNIAITRLAL